MIARVEAIAEAAAARAAARLAEGVREAAPDVVVELRADGVAIEGRGASRDPRLRWIGGLLR